MSDTRVTSEFWVSAFRKRLEARAIPLFVTKKGDKQSGAIIMRVSNMSGTSKIFVQGPSVNGERRWMELMMGPDEKIEETLRKQKMLDDDLWILEVEEINNFDFSREDFLLT